MERGIGWAEPAVHVINNHTANLDEEVAFSLRHRAPSALQLHFTTFA